MPTVEAQVWRDYALLLAHARNALPPLSRGGEEMENTTASDTGEIESGDSNVELALKYRAQYRRYLKHLETAALKHAQAL